MANGQCQAIRQSDVFVTGTHVEGNFAVVHCLGRGYTSSSRVFKCDGSFRGFKKPTSFMFSALSSLTDYRGTFVDQFGICECL